MQSSALTAELLVVDEKKIGGVSRALDTRPLVYRDTGVREVPQVLGLPGS